MLTMFRLVDMGGDKNLNKPEKEDTGNTKGKLTGNNVMKFIFIHSISVVYALSRGSNVS